MLCFEGFIMSETSILQKVEELSVKIVRGTPKRPQYSSKKREKVAALILLTALASVKRVNISTATMT